MTPSTPCAAALAELVALKDLKRETEALHMAGALSGSAEGWYPKYEAMRKDYIKRHAPAWEAARAELAADKLQTEDQGQSGRCVVAPFLTAASSIDVEVRRDAERYQWLRRFDHFARVDGMLDTTEYTTLDAAVDAAIATEHPAGCGFPYCGGNAPECKTCRSERAASPTPSDAAVQAEPPKCDDMNQCSPEARYDEVSHGHYSLTLKCRLCGGIRRSDWD